MKIFEAVIRDETGKHAGAEMVLEMRSSATSMSRFIMDYEKLPDGSTVVFSRSLLPADRISAAIEILRESLAETEEWEDETLPEKARVDLLSPRERNVYGMLSEGKTSAEIAEALYVSIHTVRNHRKAIYRKLGISSQIELIRMNGSR